VHLVGHDVLEQALVVRHQHEGAVRRAQRVHPARDRPERVDVEPGVGLVEERQPRGQHRELEHLVALLLAAGEALVDAAAHERLGQLHEAGPLPRQLEEVGGSSSSSPRRRRAALRAARRK